MSRPKSPNSVRAGVKLAICLVAVTLLTGCASWTNPVANGIPVRLVPDELLAQPKEAFEYIPWGALQRTPPEKPIIQPEDVLGVYIVGVLGSENQLPPVQLPDASNVPPALGFPIPVRDDGTIPLPMIDDPVVVDLTVEQAEAKLKHSYFEDQKILQPNQSIIVTMIRPKHVRVVVVRQDSQGSRASQFFRPQRNSLAAGVSGSLSLRQGAGFELEIPATEADVLSALSLTGGLPGIDAKDDILIYRKKKTLGPHANPEDSMHAEPQRIPLKVRKGSPHGILPRDISLGDGDIVVVENREPEWYYTGGLMFNQEIPLPYDYDLTVVEAVSRIGGPMLNGGFGGANLNGNIVSTGLGNPSPSLLTVLRQAPNNQQVAIRVDLNEALRDPRENIIVKTGDILILQETTGESFARYISNVFSFGGSGSISRTGGVTTRSSAAASGITLP